MASTKPLMLKDLLALDDGKESCDGFQCIIAKISAAISAVKKNGPVPSPSRSFLPRSLSTMLLGRSFWRRAAKEEAEVSAVRVKDIVRMRSFEMYSQRSTLYFPSPVPSSRSSSFSASDGVSSDASFDCPCVGIGEPMDSSEQIDDDASNAEFTCHHQKAEEESKKEESECPDCQIEEEKEQLSPVSVMNFPFQEDCKDSNESTSPCFEQSLANIERTKHQLLQKIRWFESLVEMDPVNLLESFTEFKTYMSSDDYEEEEEEEEEEEVVTGSSLIRRLRSVGPHKDLLVDFFDEELIWTDNVEVLLLLANKWIGEEKILTIGDYGKEQIKDMERNGRWRYFEDDQRDLVADMEIRMLGSLVEELVLDLVS